MKPLASVLCVSALGFFVAAGCGKQQTDSSSGNSATAPASSSASATAGSSTNANARSIQITANDAMKFDTTELHAKPGETLSVTLKNIGNVPKAAMGHNWVLLKDTSAVDPLLAAAPQAQATDYIPADQRPNILAATKLLGPGESDTITVTAPDKPGRYPFVCTFPGHAQAGMRGTLIVE